LESYAKDEVVTKYIDEGLKVKKIVIVFWGWEMVYCQEVK